MCMMGSNPYQEPAIPEQYHKIGAYIINHNYGQYLQWAIRSMYKQTRKPDVLVFIDDASTDNSIEVFVREIELNGNEFNAVIKNEKNIGASKSMNLAVEYLLEQHFCDYIFGLSSDDVLEPDYIELTADMLEKAPKNVGYVYTHVRRVGDGNNHMDIHPEFSSELLFKYPFVHGSSLIKKEAWQSVCGLNDLPFEEDYDMFKRMALKGYIGKLCPKILLNWRWHGKNRTIDGLKKWKGEK